LQKALAGKPLLPSEAGESLSSSNTRWKLNNADKYCKLCCAPFDNPLTAQQHYDGKKHRRNEVRKKILEELGDIALPAETTNGSFFSAVGVGYYLCSLCNVTITSIETYLSHVQGNRHRTNLCRERELLNLTKKSKKTYNSCQDEFTDDIEVLEAGDLEPRRYLGKAEEKEFQDENIEGGSDLGEVTSSNFKCGQGQHFSIFSETQSPTNSGENSLPSWPSASEHALEKTPNYHYHKGYYKEEEEKQGSEVATVRDQSFSPLVAESEDSYELVGTSTSSYGKEQKFQIKKIEEEKYIIEELKYEKEATKQKRKKSSEGADFGKESEKKKRIKVEIDLVNEKKSRPFKDKRLKENPAEKESKKDKKKPQIPIKREEELLWDESVLGYW
ncbi:zinc finger matrin-type protein 1-like, partial [Antrostomus carolinensis]|uniref:zinc finger matrin-type protein 1-like n=1 Tax=Antrostomus carolinensis TaxID=279965 RepID=UPI0010A9929E